MMQVDVPLGPFADGGLSHRRTPRPHRRNARDAVPVARVIGDARMHPDPSVARRDVSAAIARLAVWTWGIGERPSGEHSVKSAHSLSRRSPVSWCGCKCDRVGRCGRTQTRPYVIVDFEFQSIVVMLAVRNIGTTPAREVRIRFDPPLQSSLAHDPSEFAVFADGSPMLAPGRAIRHMFGTGPQFFPQEGEGVPLRYEAQVQYTNLGGKRYDDPPLVLDLLPFKNSALDREELHELSQNLKDIKNLMKSWATEGRPRVNTETQAEVLARHRERLEKRQAVSDPRQEPPEPG